MHSEPEDDDFVELERVPSAHAQNSLPDVLVRITIAAMGRAGYLTTKARATISFRGAAGAWLAANGPRFRVLVGGENANFVRIVPDMERGQYVFHDGHRCSSRTKVMSLNVVSLWPNEDRKPTMADWKIASNYLLLELPADFAKPTVRGDMVAQAGRAIAAAKAAVDAVEAVKSKPYRMSALAPRVIDRRQNGVVDLGGMPAPGRSALDQRRAVP